jgi:hypothetical protein
MPRTAMRVIFMVTFAIPGPGREAFRVLTLASLIGTVTVA